MAEDEPILFTANIKGKQTDVTYSMLTDKQKQSWDQSIIEGQQVREEQEDA